MSYIVSYRGIRKDGTVLFVHTCTGPDKPVYVSVIRNGIWKESKPYYYEEDAMADVNNAWPDVVWTKIRTVEFVKYIVDETIIHEDDYAASIVADYFEKTFDLEDVEDSFSFQLLGKWYKVEFGYTRFPDKYGYWQFYDDKGNELTELGWNL